MFRGTFRRCRNISYLYRATTGRPKQLRRTFALDDWFSERGLGDRTADAAERNHSIHLGLDNAGAVFEDARLFVLRFGGEPPAERLVTIRERLRADGTPRPCTARTPPGWRHTDPGGVTGACGLTS
jgi:hypothetical protein